MWIVGIVKAILYFFFKEILWLKCFVASSPSVPGIAMAISVTVALISFFWHHDGDKRYTQIQTPLRKLCVGVWVTSHMLHPCVSTVHELEHLAPFTFCDT